MKPAVKLGLFLVGATVFNLAMAGLGFIASFWLYTISLGRQLGAQGVVWGMGISFALGLACSVFAYRALVRWLKKRFNLEAWLDRGGKSRF